MFKKLYSDDNIIKKSEKLPNKVKTSLEKGKIIQNEWKNYSLNSLINDCINIENNIRNIKILNKINFNDNYNFKFIQNQYNNLIKSIKIYGIIEKKNTFIFKKYEQTSNWDIFKISGENYNILTKIKNYGKNNYIGKICEGELEINKIYKWKIKILKSSKKRIIVGISLTNFPDDSDDYCQYGWHFNCYDSKLYSKFDKGKQTNLSEVKDEIIIVFDSKNGTLKFIINNEDKGNSYTNIPLEEPLTPIVFLYDENDSVMINKYKDDYST